MRNRILLAFLFCTAVYAADEKPAPLWENSGEASILLTSGNSELTTIGLGAASTYRPDPWAAKGKFNFLTSRSSGIQTAESYELSLRGERKVAQDLSLFLAVLYYKNLFAGFERRLGSELGANYRILEADGHLLSAELAFGIINERLRFSTAAGTGSDERTFGDGRLGLEYKWKISESAEFSNVLSLLNNFSLADDFRLSDTAALTTVMTEILSLKVSFKVDYLNRPVLGKKSTDTTTSVAFIAKF